jgi:hypothetical protein
MNAVREKIEKVTKVLSRHKEGKCLLVWWKKLEWKTHISENGSAVEADLRKVPVIHVYPAALKNSRSSFEDLALLAFGKVLENFGDVEFHRTWKYKLQLPFQEHLDEVQSKLGCPVIRRECKTYRDVLDTYPNTGSSVPRLVFVNISNALLAHGVPYTQSQGINLSEWGATSEYCRRQKRHSLVPLISAYAPRPVYEYFHQAFKEWVLHDLNSIRDSSVAKATKVMLAEMVSRLELDES